MRETISMQYRNLGPCGLKLSALSLGALKAGYSNAGHESGESTCRKLPNNPWE
jgi:aryl-alcohol dehydrogenase-like predicted oxidoreductase